MKAFYVIMVSLCLFFSTFPISCTERINIGDIKINTTKVSNARELVRQSSLIVYGTVNIGVQEYPAKEQVSQGKLINYVQNFKVSRTIKGSAPSTVKVITTGVDPYPKPTDPINKIYSGPFEAGEYILFLRPIPNTSLNSVVGIWQGVYPVLGGRSIALEESGFPQLNGLNIDQFSNKIGELR